MNKYLKLGGSALTFFFLVALEYFFVPAHAFPDQHISSDDKYLLQAVRIARSPKVDGILEDEIWNLAPAATDFTQKQPDEGTPATEKTEVKIIYDNDNIYIGIMCYDSEPQKIIATEKRRDSDGIYDNDNFQIMLDTFHDLRNGYIFVTNPLGARLDIQIRKEGQKEGGSQVPNTNINKDWNGVWEVRSFIGQKGWSAEVSIPFATLRFDKKSKAGWGLNFLRNVRRKNEESTWMPLPRNLNLYKTSLSGTLEGLEDLKKVLNFQIKPFALASNTTNRNSKNELASQNRADAGMDVKYGISSNLTMDLTYNTEFSQVEADYQQVNLTRFSLFFPEKRDFFLENSAVFGVGTPDDAVIFFSRRIGISENGEEIPLLGGVKIAGKSGRFSLGLINLLTQSQNSNPANNFTVLRVSRDILQKSSIGFLATNRQSKHSGDYNRAYALDGDFIFGKNLNLNGYYAHTMSPGASGKSSAVKLGFQWLSDLIDWYGYYFDIQEDFNAEMGYVRRTGIRRFQTHFGVTPEPKIKGIRRLDPHTFFSYNTDQQNKVLLKEQHYHLSVSFTGGGSIGLEYNYDYEFLDIPFPVRSGITVPVGRYTTPWWQTNLSTNRSRSIYGSMTYRWGSYYGGKGRILNARAGFKPVPNLATEISLVYNDVNLRQGDFKDQLLRGNLIYNFSTRLALMSLVQWNKATNQVDMNVRLNFIYRPGSDLYIVYNERRLTTGPSQGLKDRALIIKLTYLFNY